MRRLAVAAALMVVASCGGGDGDSSSGSTGAATFQPIEPILAGAIDITPDSSGTSATFEVGTTIPVACAVIYGTDESFGSIAVDSDMQGGAHEDHGPLLTGLEPDTDYLYVLQGSDAAGIIYRSDTMTFRTPPAVDTAVDNGLGPNIAPTATAVSASSAFSGAFSAELAIDGDVATEWSTDGDGDDAWIEVDLGTTREVAGFAFRTRQMTDGTAITQTFTVTVDGETIGPFTAGDTPVRADDGPLTAQVIRFDADETTGGNTGATEIEIYTTR